VVDLPKSKKHKKLKKIMKNNQRENSNRLQQNHPGSTKMLSLTFSFLLGSQTFGMPDDNEPIQHKK